LKRPLVEDLGAAIDLVASGDLAHLRQHYPQPMSVVGDITRALICAAPGHRLIAADFSGIESRVTAWVSGQQSKLDQWMKFDCTGDPDDEPYFIIGRTFGIAREQARPTGKTADLAFGYMGGIGAWEKLAPPDDTSTEAEIKRRQQTWRNAHPQTVRFWGAINRAAIQAVRKPGIVIECGRLAFKSDGTFLHMKLPSGRKLAYPFPRLKANDRGDLAVVFMDNQQGKWTECRFGHGAYGGIWIENAVQAIARDVFAAAMLRLEAAGYRITLHVHDEIVAEVPDGTGSAEEFLRILTLSPGWADGLPIAAKVRNGPRFCKIEPPATTTEAPPLQPEMGNSEDAEIPGEASERTSDRPIGSESEHNPPPPPPPPPRGNGGATQQQARTDGSKAEAERDTYAEDHAGEPFSDAFLRRKGYQLAHVFDYTLADRALLYQQNRYELKSGIAPTKERPRKKFLPHRSVNGKDILGAGERRVVYNWPAIMRAGPGSTVFAPEGENKAKALIDAGLLATTVISHKWAPECVAALTGCHLIILADHDKDGERLAGDAQRKLAPVAASTRIVPAAHLWKHLPGGKEPKPGDDVKDWIKLGGDPKKLLDICREIPADGASLGEWNAGDDVDPPPPRGWLLGNVFARRFVSSLYGDGGTGKTATRYTQYLSLATGKPLTGEHVFQRCRVLIVSLEDDDRELRRRIRAARLYHKIELADVDGWLFLSAPGKKAGKLVELDDKGRTVCSTLAANLEEVIVRRQIDLVGLDPFIKTHAVDENVNKQIDAVVEVLTELAAKHDIAVDTPHHTRKGPADPGNADRGRGASAQKDAGRLIYTLTTMSADEAKAFGLEEEERHSLIRMDSGKINIAPKLWKAKWFRLVGVQLDNATERYPSGDNVQTVEPWVPPDIWQDMDDGAIRRSFDRIDAGLPDGNRYSDTPSAKTRAAWKVVVEEMPGKTETQAREIIKTWVKNGLLERFQYENPKDRKQADGLRVKAELRPA
jgi:hypothetical protein